MAKPFANKLPPTKAPQPVDVYVGSRIRMQRQRLGLSQTELGEAVGITFQQIQKYEKGANRVGSSRLQQIANFLQVSVNFFFEGAPGSGKTAESKDIATMTAFLADPDGARFMQVWKKLRPNRRKLVVRFVRSLLEVNED
jgi:transcriptional regulator with XRE-family HTH domain